MSLKSASNGNSSHSHHSESTNFIKYRALEYSKESCRSSRAWSKGCSGPASRKLKHKFQRDQINLQVQEQSPTLFKGIKQNLALNNIKFSVWNLIKNYQACGKEDK